MATSTYRRRANWVPYLFIAPNILLVLIFSFYPLVYNFILSTQEWSLKGTKFVAFDNYVKLWQDSVFWTAVGNTIFFTFGVVPPTVVLALAIAIGLNRQIWGRLALRSAYLLPNMISWVVVGLIWKWLFSANYGILNAFLNAMHLPEQLWLQDPRLTLPCIIVANIWGNVGYYMVIFLAGLQSIPLTYYEAAEIDGAGGWSKFRFITLPLLRPIFFMVTVLSIVNSFRAFDQIYVMTGGGPGRASLVMVLYIYLSAFEVSDLSYAATMAVILFGIVFGLTLIQKKVFGE
jgi:ABC-type sugar transport system permease subunit